MADMVKIVHEEHGFESEVVASTVDVWRESGWVPAEEEETTSGEVNIETSYEDEEEDDEES